MMPMTAQPVRKNILPTGRPKGRGEHCPDNESCTDKETPLFPPTNNSYCFLTFSSSWKGLYCAVSLVYLRGCERNNTYGKSDTKVTREKSCFFDFLLPYNNYCCLSATSPPNFFGINKLLQLPCLLWRKSFWPWIFPSDVAPFQSKEVVHF